MSKKIFTEREVKLLLNNPNVKSVSTKGSPTPRILSVFLSLKMKRGNYRYKYLKSTDSRLKLLG